jgi:hypothetical protein
MAKSTGELNSHEYNVEQAQKFIDALTAEQTRLEALPDGDWSNPKQVVTTACLGGIREAIKFWESSRDFWKSADDITFL